MELSAQQCSGNFCQQSLCRTSHRISIATLAASQSGTVRDNIVQVSVVSDTRFWPKISFSETFAFVILATQTKIIGRWRGTWYVWINSEREKKIRVKKFRPVISTIAYVHSTQNELKRYRIEGVMIRQAVHENVAIDS